MDIIFRSIPFFYEKEESGIKNNTVREVGDADSKFESLLWMLQTKEYGRIVIVNSKTEKHFNRKITDVSFYDDIFIITWKHDGRKVNKVRRK